ncbi:SRPBCC family protein [Frigoribacterium sp. 2-23]|uniref:SRPBCC family protein n=1 Tax=Frigoribacterium sp. 2-23 TaxID=3415006 RepID=UPI003C6F290E
MSTNQRFVEAAPSDVFAVLADGWLFPSWVVGASRIRDVDLTWPSVGATIAHSFGSWPLVIDDTTTLLEWQPDERAVFQARGWPLGEARITLEVQNRLGGCLVRMTEEAVSGPGSVLPSALLDLPLRFRNDEALQRLAWLAEGRLRDTVQPS